MEKSLKAVLVGCGGMCHAWLNAAKNIPALEIAGLVDIVEEHARMRAHRRSPRDGVQR